MEWRDPAIVLSVLPHGEHAGIARLLTREHGLHAGLVQGARSRGKRGDLQPGNLVMARWTARLADSLGQYEIEPVRAHAAALMDDPLRLGALQAAAALAAACLPEREPHPRIYDGFEALLAALPGPAWGEALVLWELGLLADLGYGLELTACAATGATSDLGFVSPRSGRAVSRAAAGPWKEKLLKLPGFLCGQGAGEDAEILDGLALTGYFLERFVLGALHRPLPDARQRFVARLARHQSGEEE